MNDYTETAASDTEEVSYDYSVEPTESSETSGEIIINNPAVINIIDSREYSSDQEETTAETENSETEIFLEDIDNSEPIRVLSVSPSNNNSRASLSRDSLKNLWTLSINNNEYKVLFPVGAELDVIDGVLINRGSSNITGVVIDSSLSDSSYFNYTFTILPFTSSSSQNTVYRYGSRSYLTRYYQGASSSSLVTDVNYYNAHVIDRPVGWSFNTYNITVITLLAGLLIINFIGGLIRR